jgi:tripeptidyl-peptidase I
VSNTLYSSAIYFLTLDNLQNLDIQYTMGIASGVPTTYISVGDDFQDGAFGGLDIINFLLNESAPPQVLTTSYDVDEPDVSIPLAKYIFYLFTSPARLLTMDISTLCNAYAQLGARGVSILFASGDGGVGGGQSGESCTTFIPTFPNACPLYVTIF